MVIRQIKKEFTKIKKIYRKALISASIPIKTITHIFSKMLLNKTIKLISIKTSG